MNVEWEDPEIAYSKQKSIIERLLTRYVVVLEKHQYNKKKKEPPFPEHKYRKISYPEMYIPYIIKNMKGEKS